MVTNSTPFFELMGTFCTLKGRDHTSRLLLSKNQIKRSFLESGTIKQTLAAYQKPFIEFLIFSFNTVIKLVSFPIYLKFQVHDISNSCSTVFRFAYSKEYFRTFYAHFEKIFFLIIFFFRVIYMILKNSLILIKGLELSVQRIQKHKFNSGEAEFFSFGCLYFLLETENFDPKSIDLFLNFGSFLKLSCLIYLVFFLRISYFCRYLSHLCLKFIFFFCLSNQP